MGFFNLILFVILPITFLFYQSIFHLPIVSAKDTLMPGDKLLFNNTTDSSSSTLLSSNGIFTLGFFTIPGYTYTILGLKYMYASDYTYLGIWYTNEKKNKRVWVANHDLPIRGDAILTLDSSGNLKVKNKSGATLFNVSYNEVGSSNNTRAMLQDSGNFLVCDEANRTIWQSFDHPTDTLLPGMKLGYNLTTKKNWELTSAVNYIVPTSGAFTMRLEEYQNSPQLLVYRRGVLYWASGPWNKSIETFEFLDLKVFNLIIDPSGMYLIVKTIDTDSSLTTLQLSPTGEFIYLQSPDFSAPNNACYGYQSGEGCVDSASPKCRTWDISWLSQKINLSGPNKTDDNSSLGDCMYKCWNDCSCKAFSTYNITGCMYWTEQNYITVLSEGNDELLVYVLSERNDGSDQPTEVGSDPPTGELVPFKSEPKKSRWLLFSLAIVPVLVLAYVMIKIRIIKGKENRKRDDLIHQLIGSNSFNYGDELERCIQDAPDVKIFSFKAILAATNNFSDENKLGQGGYGPVYKGKLSDDREIAVKRLSKTSGQGIMEFKSELILISKLQHTNLVRLYGCCIHQEEKMLIYEFMPNKSLDFFLFGMGAMKRTCINRVKGRNTW